MNIVHLAASPFVGGPESQLLGLVGALRADADSTVLSFSEGGRCRPLLEAARALGAEAVELVHNAPHYRAAVAEVAGHLRRVEADVLCCHGYKPDILGCLAARRAGAPAVAVAHGWTAATWKVRLNESLDRLAMRAMGRVVCVSEAQRAKVVAAGVPRARTATIHNAVDPGRHAPSASDPSLREQMLALFHEPPRVLVGAAGRLSPEKGYGVLVEAAALAARECPEVGFVHYGDGPLREEVAARVAASGLTGRFVLGGFRPDLARMYAQFDIFALPSFTEGLPCVVLEAFAAGTPVAATAVGGTPEVVVDGVNGRLVPPGDPAALAGAIVALARDPDGRRAMGAEGRRSVLERFTFDVQARAYRVLFASLVPPRRSTAALAAPARSARE